MATLEQLHAALVKADAAGNTADAKALADAIRAMRGANPPKASAPAEKPVNPAKDFGGLPVSIGPVDTGLTYPEGLGNFVAGVGRGMTSVGRGIKGVVDAVAPQRDVTSLVTGKTKAELQREETRRLEAPLLDTGAGAAGNITGAVAALLPTALIPGAATLPGAAAIGGGTGVLTTEGDLGERLVSGAIGAAAGPLAIGAGRVVAAGAKGARALLDPFTQAGQTRIAGRVIQQFAGGKQAAADAATELSANAPAVAGVQNTTAEASGNAGLAQLERVLRQQPELGPVFNERLVGNRQAMIAGLENIAGDEATLTAALKSRLDTTQPLYEQLDQIPLAVGKGNRLADLFKRPSIEKASERAFTLGREQGGKPVLLNTPQQSARDLHYLKLGLDGLLETAPQKGIDSLENAAITNTRNELVRLLEQQVPEYANANATYAALSRPVNEMEVGRALLEKLRPALGDFGAEGATPANFANAVRNGDVTAARATGYPAATLENVLSPENYAQVQGIGTELGKRANADNAGRVPGSNTAQNLVSQNLLAQMLGPLGASKSLASNALMQTLVGRPVQWVAKAAEPRVIERLGRAALDPQDAAALLTAPDGNLLEALLRRAQTNTVPLVSVPALALSR